MQLAKMTSVPFSVRFCKKLRFSVQFQFYKINCGFGFSGLVFLHLSVNAIFHLRPYGMTLEMVYFRAELVQLIVSQTDSELEVQRYGILLSSFKSTQCALQNTCAMQQTVYGKERHLTVAEANSASSPQWYNQNCGQSDVYIRIYSTCVLAVLLYGSETV